MSDKDTLGRESSVKPISIEDYSDFIDSKMIMEHGGAQVRDFIFTHDDMSPVVSKFMTDRRVFDYLDVLIDDGLVSKYDHSKYLSYYRLSNFIFSSRSYQDMTFHLAREKGRLKELVNHLICCFDVTLIEDGEDKEVGSKSCLSNFLDTLINESNIKREEILIPIRKRDHDLWNPIMKVMGSAREAIESLPITSIFSCYHYLQKYYPDEIPEIYGSDKAYKFTMPWSTTKEITEIIIKHKGKYETYVEMVGLSSQYVEMAGLSSQTSTINMLRDNHNVDNRDILTELLTVDDLRNILKVKDDSEFINNLLYHHIGSPENSDILSLLMAMSKSGKTFTLDLNEPVANSLLDNKVITPSMLNMKKASRTTRHRSFGMDLGL